MAHQIASGINGLHERQIVHGFPVLHNCLVDPSSKSVKVGGVGILRISVATQRLDGEKFQMKEQPCFRSEIVLGEPRFHPARWLPKESLFDHHFNELTDR
jgi:serine/threonine protein kinase